MPHASTNGIVSPQPPLISPFVSAIVFLIAGLALAAPVQAQGNARDEIRACPPMIAEHRLPIIHASLEPDQASITFLGHATFEIVSHAGVTIATDYNDSVRPALPPVVATMNRAHSTHFSRNPDPQIQHLLRGWNPEGGPARHDLSIDDVHVFNVPTNLRSGTGTGYGANSIFVFEVGDLCIAHLGHLHHVLEPEHLITLGRIDVVLAPVDGGYTLDTPGMIETLQRIGPRLVIPMHFFSQARLEAFLDTASAHYEVARATSPTIIVSRESLPTRPTILVLPTP
jgi:L-ascorbate metabolism protein UlaG (beta-lactamase superfamily)